jgi:hypothetical protein
MAMTQHSHMSLEVIWNTVITKVFTEGIHSSINRFWLCPALLKECFIDWECMPWRYAIEVFTVVIMKSAIFWDVTLCGSCKNQRFKGMYRLHHQGDKNQRATNVSSRAAKARCMLQLLVTANISSLLILVTLLMEAIHSSEISVLTRATPCNIREVSILHTLDSSDVCCGLYSTQCSACLSSPYSSSNMHCFQDSVKVRYICYNCC